MYKCGVVEISLLHVRRDGTIALGLLKKEEMYKQEEGEGGEGEGEKGEGE